MPVHSDKSVDTDHAPRKLFNASAHKLRACRSWKNYNQTSSTISPYARED